MVSKPSFLGYSASMVNTNFVTVDPWYCNQNFHPIQYTPPPTPPYLVHPVEPPPLPPPHQFYTDTYASYTPSNRMPISHVTRTFLHQMDDKITQLDNKFNQVSLLIEEKKRVVDSPNLCKDDGTVTTCRVSIPNPVDDVWHKMEERMTQMIQILDKMGKSCANSSKLINESILRREVETDPPELVKEDELGTVEDCEESTLHQQSKKTCSNMSILLPAILVHKVFDDYSERVFPQKAPVSIPRGINSIIYSPISYWKVLKIDSDRVKVCNLHENEYGKIDSKFFENFKNMVSTTHVFEVSTERVKSLVSLPLAIESIVLSAQSCEKDVKAYTPQQLARFYKIMVYKFHEDEYGKVFGEFCINFENSVTVTQMFSGLSFKDKTSWMIVLFVLVNKSGHVRGCVLFDSMLDKNSVPWNIEKCFSTFDEQIVKRWNNELPLDGCICDSLLKVFYDHEKLDVARSLVKADDKLMCCKLHEDECSKVLARSKESESDLKLLNTSVRLDVVMKCSCCNGHLWQAGLFLSSVSGTFGSPLMGKHIHFHYISSGFLFNPVVVEAMTILLCKWRKYTWVRKRVILLRGAKFKNGNVVLRVGLYLNACDYESVDHFVKIMSNPVGNRFIWKLTDVCSEDQKMHIQAPEQDALEGNYCIQNLNLKVRLAFIDKCFFEMLGNTRKAKLEGIDVYDFLNGECNSSKYAEKNVRVFDPGGYEQNKKSVCIINLNKEKIKDKDLKLDKVTVTTVISACDHLGGLQEPGRSSSTLEKLVCLRFVGGLEIEQVVKLFVLLHECAGLWWKSRIVDFVPYSLLDKVYDEFRNMPLCNAITLNPNLTACAYQFLVDTEGQSKNKSKKDQIVGTLKAHDIELISHTCNRFKQYIIAGLEYKAETIVMRQEEDNAHYKFGTCTKASNRYKKAATCIEYDVFFGRRQEGPGVQIQ